MSIILTAIFFLMMFSGVVLDTL